MISAFNKYASEELFNELYNELKGKEPVFICIGSDLVLGDSLGPLVGTFIKNKKIGADIYGTLNYPITAKEIEYARKYIKIMHPNKTIVAIDASIGNEEDIGIIKVKNEGIRPGLGVNKNFDLIGDVSIIGIVASRSFQNNNLYNLTRLNLVYKLSETIANGIEKYIKCINEKRYKDLYSAI